MSKEQLGWQLILFCKEKGLRMVHEHKFHPTRKWRFDHYFPELNCAVEFEGIVAAKSRHTTLKGYTGDCEKYNAAAKMGIVVLRYTVLNYKSCFNDLNEIYDDRTPIHH